jgi:hypothetical protein
LVQDTAIGAGYSNEFSASFGGVSMVDLTELPVEGYTEYTYDFAATSSSSVLSFTLGNDLGEFLLDDVSVVAQSTTPEPAAWALTMIGMVGCVFLRNRRMRRLRFAPK